MQEFRTEVEALTGNSVSPVVPAEFLLILVRRAEELVHTLAKHCDDADEELQGDIAELENAIEPRTDGVSAALEQAEFGSFDALSASLDYTTGRYLHSARTLQAAYDDALPADAAEALSDLTEILASLDIARQYFKTLYTQHELAVLSRYLLYAVFPALFGGALVVLSYGAVLDSHSRRAIMVVLLSTTVVLIFFPFVVLFSYTLRIATLATHTADFGPFVPRDER